MRSVTASWVVACLVLGSSAGARADMLPPWTIRGMGVDPDILPASWAGGSVGLYPAPDIPYHAVGPASLVLATIWSSHDNPIWDGFNRAYQYPAIYGEFHVAVYFSDDLSGQYGAVRFTDFVHGGTTGATPPAHQIETPPQTLRLGDNLYTISLGPAELFPYAEHRPGLLHVTVDVVPAPTPEPSALVLAGLGTALASAAAWRRRRA